MLDCGLVLVLASQSPRRKEILREAGIPFVVRVPNIVETRADGEDPESYVLRLAAEKAVAVEAAEDEFVLAADTTVAIDEHVLEKPASTAEAEAMLRILSGREHVVLTGVCLRHLGRLRTFAECTRVRFAALSEDEIRGYAACGEALDKAGGYGIQGRASRYITGITGCYFNVVGLPIARVYRELKAMGYRFPTA
jgi:septum formation protein